MNTINYLLLCLTEEVGELLQELLAVKPDLNKIKLEYGDTLALIHLLKVEHDIDLIHYDMELVFWDMKLPYNAPAQLFEVQHLLSKSMRFGLNSAHPETNVVNIDRLRELLYNLKSYFSGLYIWENQDDLKNHIDKKILKVKKYMKLSEKSGCLTSPSFPLDAFLPLFQVKKVGDE